MASSSGSSVDLGQLGLGGDVAEHVLEPLRGAAAHAASARTTTCAQVERCRVVLGEALVALVVDDQHAARRVAQPVLELVGPVHHALSGTTIAPAAAAAQNAIDHSGKLRIAIATRSPLRTPKSSMRR